MWLCFGQCYNVLYYAFCDHVGVYISGLRKARGDIIFFNAVQVKYYYFDMVYFTGLSTFA